LAMNSTAVGTVSVVIGWGYFLCWSVSFYPQVILNWKRKSVVGLSFDFVTLNITGWISYSLYNCSLFWSPYLQDQYYEVFGPPLPVTIPDVFFALHAFTLTALIIIQIFVYERGSQRVFIGISILVSLTGVAAIVQLVLSLVGIQKWLDYIMFFSYVKLGVTLLKYIPQAWSNFRRKSTEGWSIENILLDISGGLLSFGQMFLDGFNSGNWEIFLGGGAKLGLSLISIAFDVLFLVQHYCLYPPSRENYDKVDDDEDEMSSKLGK